MSTLFLSWWYKTQFRAVLNYSKHFLGYLYDLFSIRICFSTLFAVWKRDRISYKNLGIKEMFEAMTLNIASRFVGFFVKIFTIIAYLAVTLIFIALFAIFDLIWLFLPLIILLMLFVGFNLLFGAQWKMFI